MSDILLPVIIIFLFAIGILIGYKLLGDMNDSIQSDDSISAGAKTMLQTTTTNYPSVMDSVFIFLLGGLWLVLFVTTFFIDTHPFFFVISIILLIMVFVIAAILSNVFSDFTSDDEYSSMMTSFPKTTWVMNHYLQVFILMGFTTGIALYAKRRAM